MAPIDPEHIQFVDHFKRVKRELRVDSYRTDLNLNIVLGHSPAAARWAERFKSALDTPGLYPPVPRDGLHITGFLLATGIDASPEQKRRFAEMLTSGLENGHRLTLVLDHPKGTEDGVLSFVRHTGQLEELLIRAADIAEQVFPEFIRPKQPGKAAHLTLAYGRDRTRSQQAYIQSRLDEVGGQDSVSIEIESLSLVRQTSDPDRGYYIQGERQNLPIGRPI